MLTHRQGWYYPQQSSLYKAASEKAGDTQMLQWLLYNTTAVECFKC